MIAATNRPVAEVLTRPRIGATIAPIPAHADSYTQAFKRWKAFASLC
ncbi:hypothetical protein AKL17_4785 [Frigidibacter mobilis]|uniref:Uncharacterized protein n=1 Tax=Frigidibacter mobilis TaxID=1335048 RepID=A0A159Z8W1_9RHOB|nr:hypothetical protein AKL17_4785 [Frigidibacter mobilis]